MKTLWIVLALVFLVAFPAVWLLRRPTGASEAAGGSHIDVNFAGGKPITVQKPGNDGALSTVGIIDTISIEDADVPIVTVTARNVTSAGYVAAAAAAWISEGTAGTLRCDLNIRVVNEGELLTIRRLQCATYGATFVQDNQGPRVQFKWAVHNFVLTEDGRVEVK